MPPIEKRIDEVCAERARDFCKNTPRMKEESGVAFYERLIKSFTTIANETLDAVEAEVEQLKVGLHVVNKSSTRNSYCHDSSTELAADKILTHLQALRNKK